MKAKYSIEERVALIESCLKKCDLLETQPKECELDPDIEVFIRDDGEDGNKTETSFCSKIGFCVVSKVHGGLHLLKRRHAVMLACAVLCLQAAFVVVLMIIQERRCQVISTVIDAEWDADHYQYLYRDRRELHICSTEFRNEEMINPTYQAGCKDWIGCTLKGFSQQDYKDSKNVCLRNKKQPFVGISWNGCDEFDCTPSYSGSLEYFNVGNLPDELFYSGLSRKNYTSENFCPNGYPELQCKGFVSMIYMICPELITVLGASFGYLTLFEFVPLILVLLFYKFVTGKKVWETFEDTAKFIRLLLEDEDDITGLSRSLSTRPRDRTVVSMGHISDANKNIANKPI